VRSRDARGTRERRGCSHARGHHPASPKDRPHLPPRGDGRRSPGSTGGGGWGWGVKAHPGAQPSPAVWDPRGARQRGKRGGETERGGQGVDTARPRAESGTATAGCTAKAAALGSCIPPLPASVPSSTKRTHCQQTRGLTERGRAAGLVSVGQSQPRQRGGGVAWQPRNARPCAMTPRWSWAGTCNAELCCQHYDEQLVSS